MIHIKYISFVLLFCGLLTSCSSAQKNFPTPDLSPVEPLGASIEDGRFTSNSGGFVIGISEMPIQTLDLGSEIARTKSIDAGKQYVWRFETTLYTVAYTLPVDADGNSSPHVFDDMVIGTRKGALRQNAKLLSEKPFTAGNIQGTELRYVSADGINFVNRLFIAEDVGYQVVGGYIDGKEKEVLGVIDSFKLINSKEQ